MGGSLVDAAPIRGRAAHAPANANKYLYISLKPIACPTVIERARCNLPVGVDLLGVSVKNAVFYKEIWKTRDGKEGGEGTIIRHVEVPKAAQKGGKL